MPRLFAVVPKPRSTRVKKAIKTAVPAAFSVAPTTPFIPVRRRAQFDGHTINGFAFKSASGVPSAHLVDLRTATAARPHGTFQKAEKNSSSILSSVDIPRTISHRPDANRIWNQFALVAFGHFLFAILKALVIGAGQLVILPLTLGLKLVDRFDPDRPQPLTGVAEIPKDTEGVVEEKIFAPVEAYSKPEPTRYAPRATRQFNLRRALVSFAGTSLAIILPLQGFNIFRAFETLKSQAQDAQTAAIGALNGTVSFSDAQTAIAQTQQTIADLGKISNTILENAPRLGGMFRSGKAVLDAGANLASTATLLARSFDFTSDPGIPLTEKIARAENVANEAEPMLEQAQNDLNQADSLPAEIGGDLEGLKEKVASLKNLTDGFLTLAPALRNILGETQARRYLVIFQNNAELRPTGGFIGSFAIVDVDRGEIKAVEVPAGGSYDLQGSLKANVLAPEPLRLVRAKWEFQDANWYPDFPTSAEKLTWFYNQSGGPSVDGVISINAPVLAMLLDAVGPINMPAYGTVATSTTVLTTAQEIVESAAARESGKPKQFIADLLPLVLERIMAASGEQAIRTVSIFAKALEQKDIQMHFNDAEAQIAFSKLGWNGELVRVPAGFDSLGLVRANIAGAKTDAVIATNIRHESVISADGTVNDRVTVTLSHRGKKGDAFTGVRNVEYLRLYVPEGSKLMKASGDIRQPAYSFFDIPEEGTVPDPMFSSVTGPVLRDPNSGTAVNNEFGRTVFGVWTQTDPGFSSTVSFDYQLPFTVVPAAPASSLQQRLGLSPAPVAEATFGLIVEKQSGAENTEFSTSLKLPDDWYLMLASPAGIANLDGWSYTTTLDTNKTIGAIVAR